MLKLTALATALAIAGAEPVKQFDLVCTGTVDPTGIWEPVSTRLRVDLESGRWCDGECKAVTVIAEVQPATIWLEKESAEQEARGIMDWRALNRETGEYNQVKDIPMVGRMALRAMCDAAPFSGFPAIQTKF